MDMQAAKGILQLKMVWMMAAKGLHINVVTPETIVNSTVCSTVFSGLQPRKLGSLYTPEEHIYHSRILALLANVFYLSYDFK